LSSWGQLLASETDKPYFKALNQFVLEERRAHAVFPPAKDMFNAFILPLDEVKIVIIGQDPYHHPGQAHGLSFSVRVGIRTPPSLVNVFKELEADISGFRQPNHGCLQTWLTRGVLLLNSTLTVRAYEPGSHQGKGWETLTDTVIRLLSDQPKPLVFLLWGRFAQTKHRLIDEAKHVVFTAAHPSPLSATKGFFGSKPFSKANRALCDFGRGPIDWRLENAR